MANISTMDFDPGKSDKCRIKSIKGFFRYKDNRELPEGSVKELVPEIENGVYLDFIIRYFWCGENGNDCYLEIGWEPAYLDGTVSKRYDNDLSEYFNANNVCQLNINGESITANNLLNGENSRKALNSYYMKIFDESRFTPAWIGSVSNLESSIKNIEISFNYENTVNEITTYVNIDGLNKVKIFRPSKYEKNVVFNQAGLNEMIDHFQKYPVIEVKSTLTDNDTTNGKFGHIKVTRGADPNNPTEEAIRGFEYSTTENLICGKSFLPYSSESYDLGIDYLEITTDSQYIKGKTYYSAPNSDASIGTISSLADFQNALTQYNTLYTRHRWKNLYLSGDIGSESSKIGNIYATNGNFSESIKGKYEGLPNGLTGDSININDKFIVDDQGNVTMDGDITWGNNPIQCVYHRAMNGNSPDRPTPPADNRTSFDDNSNSDWHKIVQSTDIWASMSYNGGKTWNPAIRINAKDGERGDDGEWDNTSILTALKEAYQRGDFRGIESFEDSNGKTKIGLAADAIYAQLASFGQIEMDPGPAYDGTIASIKGGYISFYIPSPISYEPAKNSSTTKGWKVRFGFLKGNGDGATATNGLGLVIYSASTINNMKKTEMNLNNISDTCYIPKYNADNTLKDISYDRADGTSMSTKHLVLSFLILTQSGLGLMTQTGLSGDGSSWCASDTTVQPHYYYRYWIGSGGHDEWGIPRNYRLWLDENNGGLYWISQSRQRMYAWTKPSDKTA